MRSSTAAARSAKKTTARARKFTQRELDTAVEQNMEETLAWAERYHLAECIEQLAERYRVTAKRQPATECGGIADSLKHLATLAQSCVEIGSKYEPQIQTAVIHEKPLGGGYAALRSFAVTFVEKTE